MRPRWQTLDFWKEKGLSAVEGLVIEGLLYLLFQALKHPVEPVLFVTATLPLVWLGLAALNRVAPRRPDIQGRIDSSQYANTPDGRANILVVATITNRGLASSLDEWAIMVQRGKHRYILETFFPPKGSKDVGVGAAVMKVEQETCLITQTLPPIRRGQLVRGWLSGSTAQLTKDELSDPATELSLWCLDAFSRKWQINTTSSPVRRQGIPSAFYTQTRAAPEKSG